MKFNSREIKDLFLAGIMISLAFAILLAGGYNSLISFNPVLFLAFIVAFFTAGTGFLLHELMHKYLAQRYKLLAEFHAFYNMLWLALLFSLFGFIMAAPGAVFIRGAINRGKNGKISLAGPMTNIILGIIFLILLMVNGNGGMLGFFLGTGLTINALLGAFNMIPLMPFDGAKVLAWNKSVYWLTTGAAILLFLFALII